MAVDEITRAVPDSYALYNITLGHTPRAALILERTMNGSLTLVISVLAMVSASGMATCGEPRCRREHPVDMAPLLRDLAVRGGAEIGSPTLQQAAEIGALYRHQVTARYVGDAVLAACDAAIVARTENVPLLTTPRSRYCYVTGMLDSLAPRIEIE